MDKWILSPFVLLMQFISSSPTFFFFLIFICREQTVYMFIKALTVFKEMLALHRLLPSKRFLPFRRTLLLQVCGNLVLISEKVTNELKNYYTGNELTTNVITELF